MSRPGLGVAGRIRRYLLSEFGVKQFAERDDDVPAEARVAVLGEVHLNREAGPRLPSPFQVAATISDTRRQDTRPWFSTASKLLWRGFVKG